MNEGIIYRDPTRAGCRCTSCRNLPEQTGLEIQICPECFGTGMANHYLTDRSERECWRCTGLGEIVVDTGLVRD